MKSVGRRLFAGLLASAPVAANAVNDKTAQKTVSDFWPDHPLADRTYEKTWNAVQEALLPADTQNSRREAMREHYHRTIYIDPGIAALKSISPVHRARMQADRNERIQRERQSLKAKICAALGVDPEKF
jgi:hypothetical protein